MIKRNISINGINKLVVADPEVSLADVLRGQLGLTVPKLDAEAANAARVPSLWTGSS